MAANQSANQPISQAGAGTTHILTGISGMKWRCLGIWGSIGTTGTVQFKSSGGTALTGNMNLTAGQPFSAGPVSIENGEGLFETPSGEGLDVISGTGAFNGLVSGQWIPA